MLGLTQTRIELRVYRDKVKDHYCIFCLLMKIETYESKLLLLTVDLSHYILPKQYITSKKDIPSKSLKKREYSAELIDNELEFC